MFGFKEKINTNDPQLDLFKDAAAEDHLAELYTPEANQEDREREEKMINETLTRNEWDNTVSSQGYVSSAPAGPKLEDKPVARNISPKDESREEDEDKPGYELYGRFAKFKERKNTKRDGLK